MGKTSNLAVLSNTFDVNASGAVGVGGSTGTSGQVLTSQGSGAAPQWANSPGSLTLLATITPANGATTASVTDLSAYESFILMSDNVTVSSNTALTFALSSNNGSSYGSGVGFTNGNGTTPLGQAQIFRAKTAGANKPYSFVGAGSVCSFGSYSSVTGVINAIQIGLNIVGPTFTGSGVVYVYGLG